MKMRMNSVTLLLILSAAALASCTNGLSNRRLSSSSGSGGSKTGINNIILNFDSFKISSITVGTSDPNASGDNSQASTFPVTVQFNLGTSSTSMLNNCTSDQGDQPCLCKFSWQEKNTNTVPATTIDRLVFTNVTSVQKALVGCTTPDVWSSEIPNGQAVNITVVPASGNVNQFTVSTYAYTKGQNPETGNFSDNQGRAYVNILRYSCYEQRKRGLSIVSRMGTASDQNIGDFKFPMANKFCVRKADGSSKVSDGCENLDPVDFTAQSYYYNLFIRDSESGDINPGNARFICPTVKEALNDSGTGGTQGKYWPLDSSFALSLGKTTDFTVGVVANTKTTNLNDPTANNTTCDGTTSSPGQANSLVFSCLGFAAKPNVDGTCPMIAGKQTYRLRRYIALYPPIYDTDGTPLNEPQSVDTVYVVDRPVAAGANEYTMLGPKPCPFAFFDRKNVTGKAAGLTGYVATNDSGWNNKNVDGIQFPFDENALSCKALLPIASEDQTKMSLMTLTQARYVRPISAWAPHYEEDLGFQACAPLANPLRDPPLHFAKTAANNVAWCAEAYPTQNDNVAKNGAANKPYTSHTPKNAPVGACPNTTVTGDVAHAGTCDRTVVNPVNGITWPRFPLLAQDTAVESALSNDPAYSCAITYDNGGASNSGTTKVNLASLADGTSPSQGCCSNVTVTTGAGGNTSAHLDPLPVASAATPSCTKPNY